MFALNADYINKRNPFALGPFQVDIKRTEHHVLITCDIKVRRMRSCQRSVAIRCCCTPEFDSLAIFVHSYWDLAQKNCAWSFDTSS